MNNKSHRIFKFKTKADVILYLQHLIDLIQGFLVRYELYLNDIVDYVEREKSINNDFCQVPAKTYYEFYDKIGNVKLKLLNLIADNQKSSVSYSNFRDIVSTKYDISEIPTDIIEIMNELRDKRNWLHHWPQSILNAENNIQNSKSEKLLINPIIFIEYENYDIQWLNKLFDESYDLLKKVKRIYKYILLDYSILIETHMDNIHIEYKKQEIRFVDSIDQLVPNISWLIQRGKLK